MPLLGFLAPVFGRLGHFWLLLSRSGAALGHFWAAPGRSWALLTASWPLLGASWLFLAALGPLLAALGPLLAALGPLLDHLGAILGRSWGLPSRFGVVLGCHLGVIFGTLGGQVGLPSAILCKKLIFEKMSATLGGSTILEAGGAQERPKTAPRRS